MSTTIDEKIVSMQFDNSNFEKNVKTSMSTLDKLKAKFNFKKSADSLNGLGQAADGVSKDISEFEAMSTKAGFHFSDVWQKVSTVFEYQVANRIIAASKNMISALTIDPVKMGFSEYETQINSVQTILANTEKEMAGLTQAEKIERVNGYLDQLNTYADKTIYNFTEMTRNIGTFTAAGVDLDTSVTAIQGIANLAAVSGSTSQQASTAMYQLSQALSSGTVKLMDWNSVVNAGMGGQVFQDALKETARVHGVAIDSMIESQGSFRETLSEGWLTSDILTETLAKFTMATEGLTEAEIEQNRQMLKAKGYTDEQIESIFQLGNTATNAATKVKTFTQLMDTLKEAAQSGWTQTWEIIIGDFEEAKELFTKISDTVGGFIGKMSDARNWLLEKALNFAAPWKSVMDKLDASGLTKIGKAVSDVTDKLKYFQEIVSDVWIGNWKTSDTGRYELLDAAGYDHRVVQDLVNLGYGYQITIEDIEASHKKFGLTMDKTTESTQEVVNSINNLTEEQLKAAGLTDKEIEMYKELAAEAKRTGRSIEDLTKEMSETSGRTHLIEGLANIGKSLAKIFSAMGKAWREIFPPMSFISIYNALKAFRNFTEGMIMSEETADKLKRTFKGLFAVIDIIFTVLGGPVKLVLKIFSSILKACGITVLEFTAYVGDALVQIRDWIDHALDFTKIIGMIGKGIKEAWKSFKEWIRSLKDSDNLAKDIADGIWNGIIAAFKGMGKLIGQLGKWLFGWFEGISGDSISGFVKGIWNSMKLIGQVMWELGKNIVNAICEFLGIHSPSKVFMAIGGFIISGLAIGLLKDVPVIGDAIKKIGSVITDFFGKIDFGKILTALTSSGLIYTLFQVGRAFGGFGKMMGGAGSVMESAAEVMEESATSIAYTIKQFGKCLNGFSKATKAYARNLNANALKEISIALLILVASVAVIALIGPDKLWDAVGLLGVLAIILVALFVSITTLGTAAGGFEASWKGIKGNMSGLSTVIIQIGLTVLMFAAALAIIGNMNSDKFEQGVLALLGFMAALLILIQVYKKIGAGGAGVNADKVGKMLRKIASSLLVISLVIWILGSMNRTKLLQGGIAVTLLTALIGTLIWAVGKWGKDSKDAGMYLDSVTKMFTRLGTALLLMSISILILGTMKSDAMWRALGAVSILTVLVGAIITIVMYLGKGKATYVQGVGSIIMGMAALILAIAVSVALLGYIDKSAMDRGMDALTTILLLVTGMVAVIMAIGKGKTMNISGAATMFLGIAALIGIIAIVVAILGYIDSDALNRGMDAVSEILLLVTGMVAAILACSKGIDKGAFAPILSIAVVIAAIAASLYVLADIEWQKLIPAAASLATVIATVSLIAKQSKGFDYKDAVGIGAIAVVVAGLAFILKLLTEWTDPYGAIASAAALSILIISLSACMSILKTVNADWKKALEGAISIALLCIPLLGVAYLLRKMDGLENAIEHSIVLAGFLTAMVGVLKLCSMISATGAAALTGLGYLSAGIAILVALLGIIGGVVNAIPGGKKAVQTGIDIFVMLAEGVGKIITILIESIGTGIANSIIKIGEALSDFADNLEPFISIVSDIPPSCGKNIALLTAAILALTAASLLNAIMDFFNIGTDWGKMGKKLCDFARSIRPLAEIMDGIPPAAIDGVSTLAKVISGLTGTSIVDSIADFFGGGIEEYVKTLTEVMPDFGKAVLTFSQSVVNIPEESLEKTKLASDIIKALCEAAKAIPKEGGLWGEITGQRTSLETFAGWLPGIAEKIMDMGEKLEDFDDTDVEKATAAAELIGNFANISIPKTDKGMLGWVTGDNQSIGSFAKNLPTVGESIKKLCAQLSYAFVTEKTLDLAEQSAGVIAALSKIKIDSDNSSGSIFGWLTSDDKSDQLAKFCEQLPSIGKSMNEMCKSMSGVTQDSVTAISTCADILEALTAFGDLGEGKFNTMTTALSKVPLILNAFLEGNPILNVAGMSSISPDDAAKAKEIVTEIVSIIGLFNSASFSNLESLEDAMTSLKSSVSEFKTVTETLPDSVENIVEFNKDMAGINEGEITSAVGKLTQFVNLLKTITEADISNSANLGTAVKNLAAGCVDKFCKQIENEKSAEDSIKSLNNLFAKSVSTASTSAWDKFKTVGKFIVEGIAKGITTNQGIALTAVDTLTTNIETRSRTNLDEHSPSRVFAGIGKYVVEGLAKGIHDNLGISDKSAAELSNRLLTATQDELGIHSPSLVFNKSVGRWIVEGITEGIDKDMTAEEAAKQKASNIKEAFEKELNRSSVRVDTLEIEYEKFQLRNPNATDKELDTAYLNFVNEQIKENNKKVKLLEDKRYSMKTTFGIDSDEYLEANNEYKKAINDGFKLDVERREYREEMASRTVEDLEAQMDLREQQAALWNERNRDATDAQRHTYEESRLLADLTTQKQISTELLSQYNNAVKTYGEEHDTTKALYTKLIKSRTDAEQIENQLYDLDLDQYDQRIADIEQETRLRNLNYELWESKNKDADELVKNSNKIAYLKKEQKDAAKILVEEQAKLVFIEKEYGKKSDEYKAQLEVSKNAEKEVNTLLNDISDLEKSNSDLIKDRAESVRDTKQDLADIEYNIWEKTDGKDATEEVKELKKLEINQRKVTQQAQSVIEAEREYQRILEENNRDYNNHEVLQAEYAWKQELEKLVTIQSEIADIQDSIAERQKRAEDRRKNAQQEYKKYVDKYRKYYIANGYTLEDLEKDAQLVSGYDPTKTAKETAEKVVSSTSKALEETSGNSVFAQSVATAGSGIGTAFTEALNTGAEKGKDKIVKTIEDLSDACTKALNSKYSSWKDTGTYLVNGLIRGVKTGKNKAVNAVIDLMRAVIGAANTVADINSPSKVFEEMGMYIDMGLAEGLRKYSDVSKDEASNLGNSVIERFRNTIAQISDAIDSDLDTQPTIRPVLDLSSVEAGTARLNTMFSHSQALSASAGIAEIKSVNDQNGNSDTTGTGNTWNFTQNNYSPKALSPTEIYRQTRNQFSAMKEALNK